MSLPTQKSWQKYKLVLVVATVCQVLMSHAHANISLPAQVCCVKVLLQMEGVCQQRLDITVVTLYCSDSKALRATWHEEDE